MANKAGLNPKKAFKDNAEHRRLYRKERILAELTVTARERVLGCAELKTKEEVTKQVSLRRESGGKGEARL